MHPQPDAPRPRWTVTLIPAIVVAATLALLLWSAWPVLRPAREVTVVQAVFDRAAVALPAASQIATTANAPTVQAPGWLEAEPFNVACTALADGVLESIHVLEGDFVEEGEIVARLIAEDSQIRLRRAEADLSYSEAALEISRAELRAATQAWDEPVELERTFEASQAALAESEAELAQLPWLIESATAMRVQMEEVAHRVAQSARQGATNELELIVANQQVAAQSAEVKALHAREPILEARTRRLSAHLRAAQRDLELRINDRRRLDAATAAVASAEASVARALAARDEAALELERMVIRAPITGYVQSRTKVPGDKVVRMMDDPHSAHIVHLYDPKHVQVRVDVPLADAAHVSVGQICEVVVEVLPDRTFQGEVLRITHEADLQKNTLQVKVRVIDPDPILRPEMLTRVKFLSSRGTTSPAVGAITNRSRVLIPTAAIDNTRSTPRVWLVTNRRNGRGVLSALTVTVINQTHDWATVSSNIQPGALVALSPEHPREGETVIVRNDAGAPA